MQNRDEVSNSLVVDVVHRLQKQSRRSHSTGFRAFGLCRAAECAAGKVFLRGIRNPTTAVSFPDLGGLEIGRGWQYQKQS